MNILIIDFLICLFIWFAIRIWFKIDKMVTAMIILVYFFAFSPYFHDIIGTRDAERKDIENWDDQDWEEDDSDFFDEIKISNLRFMLACNCAFLKRKMV